MPRPTDLVSLDQHLTKAYGAKGAPARDAFDAEVELEIAGQLLKQAREARGLTQEELGALLGVGRSQVSKIEKNLKDMRLSTLIRAFEALDMRAHFRVETVGRVSQPG